MERNILRNNVKSRYCILAIMLALAVYTFTGCKDYPVDEDGLLITGRYQCYVSNFELLGTDRQTVRTGNTPNPRVDTTACTIDIDVRFGTDLKNLYPQFSLVTDAKLKPKITGLTDFSDLANPRKYTVISGNRKVSKTYTVNVYVQQP